MKQVSQILFLMVASAIFFTSCSNDDDEITTDEPIGVYNEGYFILNEGGADPTTSSITYISENGTQTDDVFRIENPDQAEIGSYLQNIFFDDTRAFVISGQTSDVIVYNRYTFEYITTINTDLENPRYGVTLNGKAYVTNNADFSSSTDDYVTVVDLVDYTTTQIAVNNIAERIATHNNNVIVMNGSFGTGNAISVINSSTLAVSSIDLGSGNSPNSMVIEDDNLYALTGAKNVITVNLTTNQVTATLNLPSAIESPKNLDIEDDIFYFTSDASVYSYAINATSVSSTALLTYNSTSSFGMMYGFKVEDDKIYISDAGDFASNGKAFEYSITGDLLTERIVGRAPNGFYFN